MRRFNIKALSDTLGLKMRDERKNGEPYKFHLNGFVEGIEGGLVEWVACEIADTLSDSILNFYPKDHEAYRFKMNPESLIHPDGHLEVDALPNFYISISPPQDAGESLEKVLVKVECHYFGKENRT